MKTKCILKHVKNDIWWRLDNLIDASKGIALDFLIIMGIAVVGAAVFAGIWYIVFTFLSEEMINLSVVIIVIGCIVLWILCIIHDWIIKPICRYFKRVSDHCNNEH